MSIRLSSFFVTNLIGFCNIFYIDRLSLHFLSLNMKTLLFQKLDPNATIPMYAQPSDAWLDLIAISKSYHAEWNFWEYDTWLAVAIPEGYVWLLFARSSVTNKPKILKNAVGVIDSWYRWPIKLRFHPLVDNEEQMYQVGERIWQLVILPCPQRNCQEVDQLPTSVRWTWWFGSTGK